MRLLYRKFGCAIIPIVSLDLTRLWLNRAEFGAGLIQPLMYLFVLGAGLAGTSTYGDGYQRFIFPGMLCLSILLTAANAAASMVVDRQCGFFKAVLASPVPRSSLAVGKVVSGALQGWLQGVLLLPFAIFAGFAPSTVQLAALLLTGLVSACAFAAVCVSFAVRFRSTAVYPAIHSAVLIPLFSLSGGLYDLGKAPRWLYLLSYFNPVAYAVDLVRGSVTGYRIFPVATSLLVLGLVTVVCAYLTQRVLARGEEI